MAIKLIREKEKDRTSCEARVEFNIDSDIAWPELIGYMQDFIRACGYIPPEGELVWLEKSETVVTKAEKILYCKEDIIKDRG